MVLPRRNHVRVSRRHRGAGFVGLALVGIVFYLSYSWYRPLTSSFGSRRPSSSSLTTFSSMTALNAGSYKPPPDGIPLRVNISESNPRNWRNPERDFDTEYEQVLEAFPALRTTRRARIAFFIMAHGPTDVMLLARSFPWLYSPLNFYLVSSVVRHEGLESLVAVFVRYRCAVPTQEILGTSSKQFRTPARAHCSK